MTEQLNEQFKVLVESYNNHRSQLNVIFDILGTPTEEDLSHLDKRTADILRSLAPKEGMVRLILSLTDPSLLLLLTES